jgi:excisionase family DNA binding protein
MEPVPRSLLSVLGTRKDPMTVKEFAAILRISTRAVYKAVETDSLPVIRIGTTIRIDPVHAAKWLRARQVK